VIGKTQKYDSEMISFIHSVWSGLWELWVYSYTYNVIWILMCVQFYGCRFRVRCIYQIQCCVRSQWPRRLRHEPSSPARILGWSVRIPLEAWMSPCAFIHVCIVLCVGSGLATGWSPVQGVLPTVYRFRNWKSSRGPPGL
jgi:hypothetical protein